MSSLSNLEKRRFEQLFGMGGGYVLDFSNRTLGEFVLDSVGKNIFDEKYNSGSGSKANRLRAFWSVEPNCIVGRLLGDLVAYATENGVPSGREQIVAPCVAAIERLLKSAPIADLDAISPTSEDRDFEILAKAVRDTIENNEPEAGLDRLHTFTVKYMRALCRRHGIEVARAKPLHSLIGEYIKAMKSKGHLDSDMTERILKSSISILEAFNAVRNDQSLAHDNPVLNYHESLLIFSNITSSVRFIDSLEKRIAATDGMPPIAGDDIPL